MVRRLPRLADLSFWLGLPHIRLFVWCVRGRARLRSVTAWGQAHDPVPGQAAGDWLVPPPAHNYPGRNSELAEIYSIFFEIYWRISASSLRF
jgi:hypothetical protein